MENQADPNTSPIPQGENSKSIFKHLQSIPKDSQVIQQWIYNSVTELNEKYKIGSQNNETSSIDSVFTKQPKRVVEDSTYCIRKVKYEPKLEKNNLIKIQKPSGLAYEDAEKQEFLMNYFETDVEKLLRENFAKEKPCLKQIQNFEEKSNYGKWDDYANPWKNMDKKIENQENQPVSNNKLSIPSRVYDNHDKNSCDTHDHQPGILEPHSKDHKTPSFSYKKQGLKHPSESKLINSPNHKTSKNSLFTKPDNKKPYPTDFDKDLLFLVGSIVSSNFSETCINILQEKYDISVSLSKTPTNSITFYKPEWTKEDYFSLKRLEQIFRCQLTFSYAEKSLKSYLLTFSI